VIGCLEQPMNSSALVVVFVAYAGSTSSTCVPFPYDSALPVPLYVWYVYRGHDSCTVHAAALDCMYRRIVNP
jgi:hypothetical protein